MYQVRFAVCASAEGPGRARISDGSSGKPDFARLLCHQRSSRQPVDRHVAVNRATKCWGGRLTPAEGVFVARHHCECKPIEPIIYSCPMLAEPSLFTGHTF